MDRDWLAARLGAGVSIEAIARELGRPASTVAYWVGRYGLRSHHAGRHASRGGITRDQLEELVARGLSVRAIASELDRSSATVRHWLGRHGLETRRQQRYRSAPIGSAREIEGTCRIHGVTRFVRTPAQRYHRCAACRMEAVSRRRRLVKERLVEEAGGSCRLCGYDRYVGALQFHHLDPSQKRFELSLKGITRAVDELRKEAAKCVLLCANCHAEVEAGVSRPPPAIPVGGNSIGRMLGC